MRSRSFADKSFPAVLWIAALLAACGGASDSPSANITPNPNEIVVGESLSFGPAHLTVPAGTTVRWVNSGPFDHTVTSGVSSRAADMPGVDFDAALPPEGAFELTFETLGDHPYFCRFHESMGMMGIVTVTAPGANTGTDSGDPGPPAGGRGY